MSCKFITQPHAKELQMETTKQMKEKHCKYCKDKGLAWPRLPLIRLLGYYPKRNQSSLLMSKLNEVLVNQSQSSLGHFFAILGKKMCASVYGEPHKI